MVLRKLTRKELRIIYRYHLIHDFPKCERKQLRTLTRGMAQGRYVAFGGFDETNGALLCYSVVMLGEKGEPCLLDYFAVVSHLRDRGVGSEALPLFKTVLGAWSGLFVEYENPDAECADPATRKRREAFYLRNGLRRTDMDVFVFDTRFCIGYLPFAGDMPDPQLKKRLSDMYRRFGYGRNVRFFDNL